MVFSSLTFLCVFLPFTFLLSRCTKSIKIQNVLLVVASLLFYAYGEPVYILLMLASIAINWILGLQIGKTGKRSWLVLAVLLNIGLLVVFKYTGFLVDLFHLPYTINIPLPIGISFFTFQALSYDIDVYRKETPAQKSLLAMTLYISFFPQLIAGPIVKYHDIDRQITTRKTTPEKTANGIRRFTIGLAKKVLIANTMAAGVDMLMAADISNLNILSAWTLALGYLFQIYFDFSGYSDMAIGLGQMFGFQFRENFNYPYISTTIQEFWRRWHISLSTWFKEYLYIPLGGNRKGKARTILNKWVVFLATGLWHGANLTFLLWGAWHGLFIMLEQWIPVKKWPKPIAWASTLLIVTVGFVMFRADTVSQGFKLISLMFTGWIFTPQGLGLVQLVWTPLFLLMFGIAILASRPWNIKLEKTGYAISLALYVLCFLSLAGGGYNPFFYFRF